MGQSGAACNGPEITLAVTHANRAEWQALRTKLRAHLSKVRDLDRCAELTVRERGRDIVLSVRTGDGRLASRTVRTEAQLLHATEALLTLPPRSEAALSANPSSEQPSSESSDLPELSEPRTPKPRRATHVELGGGAAARLGGVPMFIAGGVAGFADVATQRWLFGAKARWDISGGLLSEPTLMDYYLMSTALGVHVGRRLELSGAALDLLLGPTLVLETQDADDGQLDIGGSALDVRVDIGARLSGPATARVRAFGSVDLELSPARLVREQFAHPGLPALPAFSCGLAVGVLWSSQ